MAAALGMLTGGLLSAAKGYGQEKMRQRQQQDEHRSKLADAVVQQGLQSGDPSFWDMPEVKKMVGDHFGPESPKMLAALTTSLNKPMEGFPTMGGEGGTQSASSQMIGAGGGKFSQPQQVVGSAPSSLPPTQVTGPGSPAEPTSVGAAPQERHLGGKDTNDPQTIRDHIDSVYNFMQQHPGNTRVQDLGKQEVEHWKDRLGELEKQQDFDLTKSQQLMEFGITKAQQQQFHEDAQANHQATLASLQQNRDFMQQMAGENQATKRQQMFEQSAKNIASQTESISKMLFTANPADADTAKTLLAQRNAQVRALKKQADAAGISYDPEEFKPLTIKQVPGWFKSHIGIGGSTSTVTEDTGAAATGGATMSKSGKKMVPDPKSPTGFSYAD